jgi:hypothetical protein
MSIRSYKQHGAYTSGSYKSTSHIRMKRTMRSTNVNSHTKEIVLISMFLLFAGFSLVGCIAGAKQKQKDANKNIGPTPAQIEQNTIPGKDEAALWVESHFTEYYQKYKLSCEAAMIRLTCGLLGIRNLSEDDILARMPKHQTNPELGMVMEDINGHIYSDDGSINWKNYGAHLPPVMKTLQSIIDEQKIGLFVAFEDRSINDEDLIRTLKDRSDCIGAIIWAAAYIDGKKPARNKNGLVEGEHVQFVSPVLDQAGRMLVYDVWPWKNQPFHLIHPFNRDLFNYDVILIVKKN